MPSRLSFPWVVCGFMLVAGSQTLGADDYELKMIDNSKTYSQAIAINAKLEVLGAREVVDEPGTAMKSYFRSGNTDVQLNAPKGFTNLEPQALSDNSLVVGYVSRPVGNENGSLRGFVWDAKTRELTLLEPLPTDIGSHAQDISADGKRISGYSTGHTPPRIRPCVWEWKADSKKYEPTVLSTLLQNNPYLQSGQVIISPNGKRIAACITEEQLSDFMFDSSLFVWEFKESGEWERKKISDEQPKLKDMNDQGTIVGATAGVNAGRACVIDPSGKIELIDLLPDDETNTAYGINNEGTVVGMSDDPHGGEGGPQAFIWRKGVVQPLKLMKSTVDSSAMAINQQGAIAGFMLKDARDDSAVVSFVRIPK